MIENSYVTDGLCHNANAGTYGHECGKPAAWIGTYEDGFRMCFCDHCKEHGSEARTVVSWGSWPYDTIRVGA